MDTIIIPKKLTKTHLEMLTEILLQNINDSPYIHTAGAGLIEDFLERTHLRYGKRRTSAYQLLYELNQYLIDSSAYPEPSPNHYRQLDF